MIARIAVIILALAMALAGAFLAIAGIQLIVAGGSWYYLPAGLALIATAAGLAWKKPFAFPLFGALLVVTLVWALWEVGVDGWALVPRLVAPAVLGLILLLPFVKRVGNQPRGWWIGIPVIAIAGVLIYSGHAGQSPDERLEGIAPLAADASADGDWKVWGRTLSGTRFSPLGDINTGNAGKLQVAWEYKSDVEPFAFHSFQATPLAADGRLYLCLDRSVVVALDQDSGKEIWRFDPKPNLDGVFAAICRGVARFEAPEGTGDCPVRILYGVADDRMMALDAATGKPCQSFGNGGQVDLKEGLGEMAPGAVFPSSPPTVVNGVAMISGWVNDGVQVREPSGGVHAYDAVTGKLLWVWDSGREEPTKPLGEGETYTRGAPNAWGVYSGDEELGLVYLGTGVSTPDYFGSHRTPEAEKYATSIVALDVKTGKPRWHFQTVHHDIWDLDVSPQPVLTELTYKGKTIPALIGPTKRAQFFVLDRRTGEPIYPVSERPVPQDTVKEDWASKTQPFNDTFPVLDDGPLSERKMWGVTPLDQLWCRLTFKKASYEGYFTPPSTRNAIFYPGSAGGSNWGSATVDTARGLLIANTLYMADIGHLIPREEADRMVAQYAKSGHASGFAFQQKGTPYAMDRNVFLNPLGVPCQQPPYGKLSVIDLKTGKLVWSKPLGTVKHAGPLGLSLGLPITMGVPNLGGSMATAGGLIFIGAAQDRMIRAIDIGNGKELWSHSLPAVAAATPMTFRSKKTGRQYVVIAAGGHPALPGPLNSSVLAFALPEGQ